MKISLTPIEARVLGVMMEKEVTTPDAYPLTLNALVAGCNQKSSRDPVLALREPEVRDAVESLTSKTLVREQGSAGGRARRYGHRLASRLFGEMQFSPAEQAVLCVLMLRGPQTPGEIRSRSTRLHEFPDLESIEAVLDTLAAREDGPYIRVLEREPGRRESRWLHLLCGDDGTYPIATPVAPAQAAPAAAPEARPDEPDRLSTIETRLASLEARLRSLEDALGHAPDDPE